MAVRSKEVQEGLGEGFTCEDSKLLEAVLDHILFHWDDIMAVLLDELIQEEVLELNRIEGIGAKSSKDLHLMDKSMAGKFHDYKSVDLREITSIFEEYRKAEDGLRHYLHD